MLARLNFDRSRYLTHAALFFFSGLSCYITAILEPSFGISEVLSVGLGYESLILLVLTLLVGPFNLLWKRRNPVNINLRRDLGIWSGITAIAHVIFSFMVYENGNILAYFFTKEADGSGPLLNLFGASNYVGLIATAIMLALLVTSNQLSLRLLKGKRWKFLQRFNYPLFVLVVIHTFMYQIFNLRESPFFYSVIALTALTIIAQAVGVAVTTSRARRRLTSPAAVVPPIGTILLSPAASIGEQSVLARRRFLVLTGALIFGGGVAAGSLFSPGKEVTSSGGGAVAQAPATTGSSGSATAGGATSAASTPTTGSSSGTNGGFNGATGNNGANGSGSFDNRGGRNRFGNGSAAPNTPAQNPATTAAPGAAPTQAANSNSRSIVLASAGSVAVGSALKFTTPDTNELAFLVHEADGSFKAFSGVCTHRPYDLVFSSSQKVLVCNLHRVSFDLASGRPGPGPARTGLSTYKVTVDGSGNVVYDMA